MTFKPKISIITVCYNAEESINDTILSVINQGYKNYEYIIVDGQSTDKTLEIIDKYRSYITKLVSDKDQGIYDAMNKGLELVSDDSDFILFLNSGDILCDNILSDIFEEGLEEYNCNLYGNFLYGEEEKIIPDNLNWFFLSRHTICHQAIFFNTRLHKNYKYNLNYKICADYEVILRMYLNGIKFIKIPKPIVKYLPGGFSDKQRFNLFKERLNIIIKYKKLMVPLYIAHFLFIDNFLKLPLRNKLIRKYFQKVKRCVT